MAEQKHLDTARIGTFTDAVMAIIMTILVLELEVPHEPDPAALQKLGPVFIGYILSFVYVGIYWNNHHHLVAAATRVTGGILLANLHLLFWLSLLPFATGWAGATGFASWPMVAYGVVLFMASIAYTMLQWTITREADNRQVIDRATQHKR